MGLSKKEKVELETAINRGWFTLREAAAALSVTYPTILNMKRRGDIKVYKIGAFFRVDAEQIKEMLTPKVMNSTTQVGDTQTQENPQNDEGIRSTVRRY